MAKETGRSAGQGIGIGLALTLVALCVVARPVHAADTLRVAKGASRAYSFMLLDVGLAAGVYKKHGLEIEESSIDGAARLHQAMVANSIDIALGAGTDIGFIAKGSPEKGVGVMATEPLNMALVLRADSPIQNMDGLKSKTIGVTSVGSLTDWFARQINFRENWTGKDAVTIAALGSADGTAAALVAGNIDALVGSVEGGYAFEMRKQGRVLFAFGDFVKPFITHAIYATNSLMDQHPDTLRRFLAAWYEGIAYMRAHKAETVAVTQPMLNMPKEWVEKVYDVETPMFPTDGHYDPKALEVVAKSLIDTDQMPAGTDVKGLVTEKFLP